jgi:hypothetical protein
MNGMIDAIDEIVARCKPCDELKTFHEFHRAHPEILAFLIDEIEARMTHGQQVFSVLSMWHYCRWKIVMDKGAATFKMNDRIAAYFGRSIVILRPEWNGWTEVRRNRVNDVFGLDLEKTKLPGLYARRVVWADGSALEDGWRPTLPHVISRDIALRPDIHKRIA